MLLFFFILSSHPYINSRSSESYSIIDIHSAISLEQVTIRLSVFLTISLAQPNECKTMEWRTKNSDRLLQTINRNLYFTH